MGISLYYVRVITTTTKLHYAIRATSPHSAIINAARRAHKAGHMIKSICFQGDAIPTDKRAKKRALKAKQKDYADFRQRAKV